MTERGTAEDWKRRMREAQARAVRLRREAGMAEVEAIHARAELECLTKEKDKPANVCLGVSQGVAEASSKPGGSFLEVTKLTCEFNPEDAHICSVRAETEAGNVGLRLSHADTFKLQRRLAWLLKEMEDGA